MRGLEKCTRWRKHTNTQTHKHTNTQTDMATLWLNQPSEAESVKKILTGQGRDPFSETVCSSPFHHTLYSLQYLIMLMLVINSDQIQPNIKCISIYLHRSQSTYCSKILIFWNSVAAFKSRTDTFQLNFLNQTNWCHLGFLVLKPMLGLPPDNRPSALLILLI